LGATYGFHASVKTFHGGTSSIVIEGAVDNASLKRVIALLREHWPMLAASDLSEQSLNRTRWKLAREYNLEYITGPALAHAIVETKIQGGSPELLERFPDLLLEVTTADLKLAATKCQQTAVTSFVGDEEMITSLLKDVWH